MSPFLSDIVVFYGIPVETIGLLLLFPLIATLVAFLRHIVGLKAFGIYTPAIIALIFYTVGFKYAVPLYVAIVGIGMISRVFLRRIRISYLPRVAITMILIAFTVLGILIVSGAYQRTGFTSVQIFPLLVLMLLGEKFVSIQIEKGTRTAIIMATETLIVAVCGAVLLNWPWLRLTVLSQPWVVLLAIPANILIGRWSGLRLTEYFRFREVLSRDK